METTRERINTVMAEDETGKESQKLLPDVVYEIFLYLPVKSLCRFLSICKKWNSLISEQSFQHAHFSRGPKHLIVFQRKGNYLHWSTHEKECFALVNKFSKQVPEFDRHPDYKFKAQSCRGLVCIAPLQDYSLTSVIVLDPVTLELTTLPPSQGSSRCIGFGYTTLTQQYKVLKFYYCSSIEKYCAKVFVLGTQDWREAKNPPPEYCGKYCAIGAPFVQGAFHILQSCKDCYCTIIAFNIENEGYKEIPVPKYYSTDYIRTELKEIGGSLCFFVGSHVGFSLCFLKDYNSGVWDKEYKINLLSISNNIKGIFVDLIGILGDGSFLLHGLGKWSDSMEWIDSNHLLCYKPPNKIVEQKIGNYFYAALYVESFKSVKRR